MPKDELTLDAGPCPGCEGDAVMNILLVPEDGSIHRVFFFCENSCYLPLDRRVDLAQKLLAEEPVETAHDHVDI